MQKAVKDFQEFYGLDKLIEDEKKNDLQPEEFTINMVARQAKWNRARAETVIKEWVTNGKAEYVGKRREPERGQKVDAWRLK